MKFIHIFIFLSITNVILAQEICDNGIDDDGDGAIDILDSDCLCTPPSVGVIMEDFESFSDCPEGLGGYLDLITEWKPAGTPQGANTCGFLGGAIFPAVPLPIPSGEGCFGMGGDEGIIRCLSDCSLVAGESYTFSFDAVGFTQFSTDAEYVLFGRSSCSGIPSGPAEYEYNWLQNCSPNFQWTALASFTGSSNLDQWESLSSTFTANANYGAVLLAFNCDGQAYSYVDNVELAGDFAGDECDNSANTGFLVDQSGDCVSGITLAVDPDTAIQYQWYLEGIAIPGAVGSSLTIDPIEIGEYQVRAIYANSLCGISEAVTIENSDIEVLELELITTDPNCAGESSGSIQTIVDSQNSPFEFEWNTGSIDSEITDLSVGNYSVTVTDANGCFGSFSSSLFEPDEISIELLNTAPLCFNETTGSIEVILNNPNEPLDFIWSNGSEESSLINLGSGNYSVTATNTNGCSEIFSTTIAQPDPFFLNDFVLQPTLSEGGIIEVFPNGGTSPYEFDWDNGSIESLLSDLGSGTFSVTATDANDCSTIAGFELFEPLDEDDIREKIYIPNAFSPNGDGANDKFEFFYFPEDLISSVKGIRIFDRWGGLIYEELDKEPGNTQFWNGMKNGQLANAGVYVYLITIQSYNGKQLVFSGDVTLTL